MPRCRAPALPHSAPRVFAVACGDALADSNGMYCCRAPPCSAGPARAAMLPRHVRQRAHRAHTAPPRAQNNTIVRSHDVVCAVLAGAECRAARRLEGTSAKRCSCSGACPPVELARAARGHCARWAHGVAPATPVAQSSASRTTRAAGPRGAQPRHQCPPRGAAALSSWRGCVSEEPRPPWTTARGGLAARRRC